MEQWKATQDPLKLFRAQLANQGIEEQQLAAIEAQVARDIEQAVAFARERRQGRALASKDPAPVAIIGSQNPDRITSSTATVLNSSDTRRLTRLSA